MSESPDTTGQNAQDDHATFLELLGTYSMTLAVIFIWFLAAISLDDQPHGLQLANLIGYSGAAFVLIFFRNRASNTRYRLTAPYVRRLLPQSRTDALYVPARALCGRRLDADETSPVAAIPVGGWPRAAPGVSGVFLEENARPREKRKYELDVC